jgi:hypothetical protein
MVRFALFDAEGAEVGEFETVAPDWWPGDIFQMGDGRKMRIRAIIPQERIQEFVPGAVVEMWEVEPA